MRHRTMRAVIGLWVLWLVGSCAKRPSADDVKMQELGGKLKAYVTRQLDDHNMANAQNMAIASCFFAREMECVAGKAPRRTASAAEAEGESQMGLVPWEQVRARIEGIVLKPDAPISGLTEDDYRAILAWALSEPDMNTIEEIRKRHGYWSELRAALGRR